MKINNKFKLLVIYIIIWISFYFLSHFTPVCFGDDLVSRFVYGTDNCFVQTIYDCFLSVYNVYSLILGRMTSVFIVVLFDNILGKEMFDICNATVFCLVVFIMARYTLRKHMLLATSIIVFFEFLFIPVFSQTNLWLSGSANYLWATFFVMIFLWVFRCYSKATFSSHLLWTCPFTLIAALCHEEFSLPISFGLLVYLFQNRKNILKTSALPIAISFIIGTGLLVFAPGNFHRSDLGNGFDLKLVLSHLAAGLYSLFFSLPIFWIFVALFVYKFRNKINEAKYFISQHTIESSTLLISPLILFVSPMYGGRITYGIEIFSLIMLLYLISTFNKLNTRYLSSTLYVLISLVYIPVISYAYNNHLNSICVQEQLKAKERVVNVPLIDGNEWIINRYIYYNIGFGPGSYYFSISPKDSNMQKASLLYSIPNLVFLPENIYRFIEDHKTNDLSSFYITREDWPYYFKQVEIPCQMKKAELILREMDFSSLPFYIRPIASKSERYNSTTVSVRNSVIMIFDHYYLFVEKSVPEVNDRVVGIKVEY